MAYSRENLKKVSELLAARRQEAIAEHQKRQNSFTAICPEIREIEAELAATGTKIMAAAMSHSLTDGLLGEIREENKRLRREKSMLLVSRGFPADWLDIKYTCEKCSDTGYVGIDMCECMKRELTLAGFASSGLANLIDSQSFENFSFEYYSGNDLIHITHAKKSLKNFAETFDGKSGASYLLLGPTGLGKTHLSTAVARVVIERGYNVVYESAQGMISDFEAVRFGRDYESHREDKYFDCDLLIIDDLGVEVDNQFTSSCVYNVLTSRINNRRSTIINTNLSQSELRERYADRITSRLFGEYFPLLFTGRDIRRQKREKR
ncbi:MAG: ATP-binding protein [Clostridia bacterium]|nr:ATP-binding protein [Clostridia bacterium]